MDWKLKLKIKVDKFYYWLAGVLPKQVCYWCFVRVYTKYNPGPVKDIWFDKVSHAWDGREPRPEHVDCRCTDLRIEEE